MKSIIEYILEAKNEYLIDKETKDEVKDYIKKNKPSSAKIPAQDKCEQIKDKYKYDKAGFNKYYSSIYITRSNRVDGQCVIFRQQGTSGLDGWSEGEINKLYFNICAEYGICKCFAMKNGYDTYTEVSFHFK